MNAHFQHFFHFLAGVGWLMGLIWLGLAVFFIATLVLIYTRWGQSHPLEKCLGLSVLAHLLMAGYITTISLTSPPPPNESVYQVAILDGDDSNAPPAEPSSGESADNSEKPWDVPPPEMIAKSDTPLPKAETPKKLDEIPERPVAEKTSLVKASAAEPDSKDNDNTSSLDTVAEPVVPLSESSTTHNSFDSKPESVAEPIQITAKTPRSVHRDDLPISHSTEAEIPEMYKLRVMPNHAEVAAQHGGTTETEKAVLAALKWLANNQATDGRWKAGDHGAGHDENVLGHSRQNAGSQSDTGVTGLALLAFLAAGNTHERGEYKENVRQGLEYLLRTQATNGNLGGGAALYEFMYCHAMATCALSESFGMTRHERLREPVQRAIGYSIASQDLLGGGWRYHPGEAGDTSQLGWQLMALKSAELSGVAMPETTRRGIARFLQSVSSGQHGGLASYRKGEGVSRSMTAEALVCWQFLGLSRDHPACNEAGDFLLTELPGQGIKPNDYYWYYGTLAMYQLQGDYWQRWNEALQKTLLKRQLQDGPLAGAWDTDTVWGGYGGRIYATAIAALTLEVYYRFLPLYAERKTNDSQMR